MFFRFSMFFLFTYFSTQFFNHPSGRVFLYVFVIGEGLPSSMDGSLLWDIDEPVR